MRMSWMHLKIITELYEKYIIYNSVGMEWSGL